MTIDALREFGLEDMSDADIHNFLLNQDMGVLGLPTDGIPYLLPMAFDFDGQSSLFFCFFHADRSRKVGLANAVERATFLVFDANSVFFWESVLLEGQIRELDEEEAAKAPVDTDWHLDIFEQASTRGDLTVFALDLVDYSGIKCAGLPPGMEADSDDTQAEGAGQEAIEAALEETEMSED